MSATKRIRDLQINDKFRYENKTYRVHASFMEGFAQTRVTVSETGNIYNRLPKDLVLNNQTQVEII